MTISITEESKEIGPPYERCCFCDVPTPMWNMENDVPVCTVCAAKKEPDELPTKELWMKQE